MSPEAQRRTQKLARHLRVKIKAGRKRLSEVSVALGLHSNYLGKVLRAPEKLKVKHLYGALEVLALHPADFFTALYRSHRPPPGSTPEVQAAFAQILSRPPDVDPLGELTGSGEVVRLAELLRLKIVEVERTQRELSTTLGFRPDHLSQILAGRVDLKVWHVFAVLEALGLEPRDFFEELYGMAGGVADRPLPGGFMWSELLSLVRRLAAEVEALPEDGEDGDDEEGRAKPGSPQTESGGHGAR